MMHHGGQDSRRGPSSVCGDQGGGAHTSYALVDRFDIDNQELAGLTPEQAFVLGVEWAQFRERLAEGRPFTAMVHTANALRVADLAERHGHDAELEISDDSWAVVRVDGGEGGGGERAPLRSLDERPDHRAVLSTRRERLPAAERDSSAAAARLVDPGLLTSLTSRRHGFLSVGQRLPRPKANGEEASLTARVARGSDNPAPAPRRVKKGGAHAA